MSNFPSVRPTLNLKFDSQPTPEAMLSHLKSVGATFDRGGESVQTATYVDSKGVIQLAPANYPRPDHDPATGEHKGFLNESEGVNNVPNSDASTYSVGSNVTSESTTLLGEPALKVTTTSGGGSASTSSQRVSTPGTSMAVTSGDEICMSWIVKIDGNSNLGCGWLFGGGGTFRLEFDAQDLTAGNFTFSFTAGFTNTFSGVENLGNDTYRIWFGGEVTASGTIDSCNVASETNNEPIIWAAPQLEEGAYPTSYTPTAGSAVTRSADTSYIDGTNFTDFYNQNEGTFLVEFEHKNLSKSGRIFTISDGTSDEIIQIARNSNNSISADVITGGTLQSSIGSTPSEGNIKAVYKYKENDLALYLNGSLIATDSSASLPTASKINIGFPSLNSYIKRLVYFPVALSDDELENLTYNG